MPLPKFPFTLHGGCNCRAIRYKISVPPFADRPVTPYRTLGADVGDARVPFVTIDHCNDCRRATSSILPMALITETATVEISCLPTDTVTQTEGADRSKADVSDDDRHWENAGLVARDDAGLTVTSTTLGHYISSPGRNRWFCTHCGTPLAYTISDNVIPKDWGWPNMFDVWLGTLDREDLEKDYMQPERMLWCHCGVGWIKELSMNGAREENGEGVPMHPLTKIDKLEAFDITGDLESLGRAGVEVHHD